MTPRTRVRRATLPNRLAALPPWSRFILLPVAGLLVVAVLAAATDALASWGRIHPGVHAGELALGGLSPADARAKLAEHAEERLSRTVLLRFEKREWRVTSDDVGASVDAARYVTAAMAVGRRGGLLARIGERASAWVSPVRLRVKADLEPEATDPLLDEVAEAVLRPPKDASVRVEDAKARLIPSEVGLHMRRDEVEEDVREAFLSEKRTVHVAAGFTPVEVSDDDARGALADVERMLSGPVRVEHEDDSWEFDSAAVGTWLSFRKVPVSEGDAEAETTSAIVEKRTSLSPGSDTRRMILEAYVDSDKLTDALEPKVGDVGQEPTDASFKVGGGHVTIVPSKDGTGPDIKALAEELTTVLVADGQRVVTLKTRRVHPEITTGKARRMGIKERLSTYTTTYDASNTPRVNNIHTLAKALDGTLIPPGGTFSFNDAIGPRTAEKGYQEAPAIVNGKLVPQLGGGICQVGTTVFNTVFFSGLPVTERHNHSFYISHYPKGRDATISWGGPDLEFRNDTKKWVLVATAFSSGSLTVSLYGTDPGYEVSYETGAFTNIRPHSTKEVKDDELEEGKRVVEDSGVDGKRCVVTRTVTKGGTVVRTDTFSSVYKPKEEVVRVGTKKVKEEPKDPADEAAPVP